MVVCAVSTIGKKREPTQFKTMVEMVSSIFKSKEWLDDAGYLSREACNLVTKQHGIPFFWPKSNSTAKSFVLFKVLAYDLCRLSEVAYYMKIDIYSSFLYPKNDGFAPVATCVLLQKASG
jgi:hypothetical protein